MRRRTIGITSALAASLIWAAASHADFVGDSVSGTLVLNDVPTNFTSGATATIANPADEFLFSGDQVELRADFSGARGTTLELAFTRTGPFGEAPNTTWTFSDFDCLADPTCTIVGLDDLGGSLVVVSEFITGPKTIEIKTAATTGGPANYEHTFQIVTSYAPVRRSSWVPNVGALAAGERPLGDLWTFVCKPGQQVSIFVDTRADQESTAFLDPKVQLVDGTGALLASGDDDSPCSHTPVCGFACPRLVNVPCGTGKTHAIIVRDSGFLTNGANDPCDRGGGYDLEVFVRDAAGVVPEKKIALGGAPAAKVPAWVSSDKKTHGPVVDDGLVPRF